MIRISSEKRRFSALQLTCAVFAAALICTHIVVRAETPAAATLTGLMAHLGHERYSPNQSEWSSKARAAYENSRQGAGEPLALLRISRLDVVAPVYSGTRRVTLDRGVGLVETGVSPGGVGNLVLSGHRDGFFRPLKDIKIGDEMSLLTLEGEQRFVVSEVKIVDALDVSVLDDTPSTMLTLITCHPFYYSGYAPDRYIVRANLVVSEATGVAIESAGAAALAAAGLVTSDLHVSEQFLELAPTGQ